VHLKYQIGDEDLVVLANLIFPFVASTLPLPFRTRTKSLSIFALILRKLKQRKHEILGSDSASAAQQSPILTLSLDWRALYDVMEATLFSKQFVPDADSMAFNHLILRVVRLARHFFPRLCVDEITAEFVPKLSPHDKRAHKVRAAFHFIILIPYYNLSLATCQFAVPLLSAQ
jgi:hypothetical protein